MTNGDIYSTGAPEQRVVFMECENLDPLIRNMEEIMGISIEHIIVPAYRQVARAYVEGMLPDNIGELARTGQVDIRALDDMFTEVGRLLGFGN